MLQIQQPVRGHILEQQLEIKSTKGKMFSKILLEIIPFLKKRVKGWYLRKNLFLMLTIPYLLCGKLNIAGSGIRPSKWSYRRHKWCETY